MKRPGGITDDDLSERLARYNREQWLWAVLAGIATIPLWLLSYGFVWFMVFLFGLALGKNPGPLWTHAICAAVMLVLLVDGWRMKRQLFDWEYYRNSVFSLGADRVTITASQSGVSVTRGNPLQFAFGASQIMLCAPRSTLAMVRHLRSFLRWRPQQVSTAAKVFNELGKRRDWVAVRKFGEHAPLLRGLETLELIWLRVENDEAQVKVAADVVERYFGPRPLG